MKSPHHSSPIDLTPYQASGFPGDLDAAIANVGVQGIDREQAQSMIRLCPETESILYGEDFSPRSIAYQKGARPVLEELAGTLSEPNPRQTAIKIMQWVHDHVIHPHHIGPTPADRALGEEDLITSERGWCNEQTRVFIALCEVLEIPSRLCFVNHVNTVCGHTAAEVFIEDRWAFFDATFNLTISLPDGRLAEGRELSGLHRPLAHAAYRPVLEDYYRKSLPYVAERPGWGTRDRPSLEKGGDLLDTIGICNYLIDGVQARN